MGCITAQVATSQRRPQCFTHCSTSKHATLSTRNKCHRYGNKQEQMAHADQGSSRAAVPPPYLTQIVELCIPPLSSAHHAGVQAGELAADR